MSVQEQQPQTQNKIIDDRFQGYGVSGIDNKAETEVQQSWEIQNSLSKQEQQPQTQFNMIDNRFQHNNHSDLLQIQSYEQNEQTHYMPNQDENGHFMLENGPLKPFAAPNLPAGNIQQQIENQQKTNLVDFSDTLKTSSESLQTVQQSYSENNKLSQTGSSMTVFNSNDTQATMSQNSSFVPGFDSNNTLVGANTIEHHKVLPEMPKDPKLYFCEICRASYYSPKTLKTHMKTKHKQEVPKLPKDPTRFYCEICSNSYKHKQGLKNHKEKYHYLQESLQPTVPATANIVLTGILDTKVTPDSNLKVHNDNVIIPNILQNSQNDNVSQPLQEIAHNPSSEILPYISLNSQNYIISEPIQDITSNLDPVIEIALNPSFEQNPNIDENSYKYN